MINTGLKSGCNRLRFACDELFYLNMVGKNKVTHFNTTITTKQNKLAVSSRHRAKILLAAAAAIIITAAIAAYSNCFDGVFLYDDHASIVENPHIRNLWPLSQAMSLPMLNSVTTHKAKNSQHAPFCLTGNIASSRLNRTIESSNEIFSSCSPYSALMEGL